MNRRQMITTTGLGIAGFAAGTGFTAPACGVSKEKAVRVTGFIIDLTKEAVPLFDLLGAQDAANLINTKAIPALEKLKQVLSDVDIPAASSALETVRNVLSGVATALLSLPDSPRRTTIMGILASVNVLLLTVEAFTESEMPAPIVATNESVRAAGKKPTAQAIREAFEATRP